MRKLACLLLLINLLAGCGKAKEEPGASPTKAPTAAPTPSPRPSPGRGANERPKDFPAEMPYYPGSKVVIPAGGDKEIVSATLSTEDPAAKVANYYEQAFIKAGWHIDNFEKSLPYRIEASRDMLRCGIAIDRADPVTLINLSLTRGEKEKKPDDAAKKKEAAKIGGEPLAKGFPEDVPLYTGSKVLVSTAPENAHTVSLVTFDKAEKAVVFYESAAKKAGWKQVGKTPGETSTELIFEKDNRVMRVTILDDERETNIAIIVAKKP